jgi:nucleotide-binding universal stress UspA family protein
MTQDIKRAREVVERVRQDYLVAINSAKYAIANEGAKEEEFDLQGHREAREALQTLLTLAERKEVNVGEIESAIEESMPKPKLQAYAKEGYQVHLEMYDMYDTEVFTIAQALLDKFTILEK